ncbi:hypothetical protein [Candidatus Venteria ishoeyi]|uniref:Uncharacterized protein n=1 Tax=Candidatus Venteria ishoeyi TaxID=1899563 RepID=A0A1H6F2V6_9GAMM|nr:hypothetical protein [Candidatus Venteria ishoeyi]SEH04487.1 Uncharacterised protein [Candidatus Venteria ishoeyi]
MNANLSSEIQQILGQSELIIITERVDDVALAACAYEFERQQSVSSAQ